MKAVTVKRSLSEKRYDDTGNHNMMISNCCFQLHPVLVHSLQMNDVQFTLTMEKLFSSNSFMEKVHLCSHLVYISLGVL